MAEYPAMLSAARAGDPSAERGLQALIYERLHELARGQLRGDRRLAQTTSLVHEVYLRLALPTELDPADRGHFFAVAATAMRQIVIDRARAAHALKRGGGQAKVTLDDALDAAHPDDPAALLQVDEALQQLRQIDARLATLVELKVFGGLDVAELADALQVSDRTVKRHWRQARAWLLTRMA